MCILIGSIGGIVSIYFLGALYRWSGSWFGGQATSEEVRAAIAWASVPTLLIFPIWVFELLIFGEEMFTSLTPRIDANPMLAFVMLIFLAIEIALGVWAFVVLVKSLGEVHRFSAWKALAGIITGSLAIALPLFCILLIL